MSQFWVEIKVLELKEHGFLGETKQHNEVLFHTENESLLSVGEYVFALVDEVMTLSLPPQQVIYDIRKDDRMRFNLVEMKEKFKDTFSKQDLVELEAVEAALRFESFDDGMVMKLGNALYHHAKNKGPVAIRITRESDQLALFQVIMDGKSQRHLDFGQAKRETVLKTGHCSMWALVKEVVDGGLDDLFTTDSPCLTGSGGFPIYVGDELYATVFVSGLHEGQDQIVLVEALSEVLGIKAPEYHGFIF